MALITCENASFAYEGNTVIEGLNFQVNEGEYLCIVGENGSGKSTLVKGLLKLKNPSQGGVTMGEGLKATEIGYLPQQGAAQKDFPASVFEVTLSGCLSACGRMPFYAKSHKALALENLRKLGIEGLRNKCYGELSGGQQQRVLLARALCATKKLLLLDEPVAGLDPLVTQDMYGTIEQMNKEEGITIIMVSHDIHSALQYASHILHLKNQQAFFGTGTEYAGTHLGSYFIGGERRD